MGRVPIVLATLLAAAWAVVVMSTKGKEVHSITARVDVLAFAILGVVVIMMLGLGAQWLVEDISRRKERDER
jgi:hypothetical protein